MLGSLTLVAYLLLVGLSLHTLAFVLYLQERHNAELREKAMLLLALGATSLALASRL